MKPFDSLDRNNTPKEYLQQIESRVTFSLDTYNLQELMNINFGLHEE